MADEPELSAEGVDRLVRVAARAVGRAGLAHAYGHVSARLDSERFLVCAPKPMSLISPRDKGTVVDIRAPLPAGVLGEVRVHQRIYARRPDVAGVCRLQPPLLMALSVMLRVPQPRHGFGAYFSPPPPLWPDPRLLRSDAAADELAELLGSASAVVMRGNGVVVAGSSLVQAVVLSWYLEDAARVELEVLRAQVDAPVLSAEECAGRAVWSGGIADRMWDLLTAGDPEAAGDTMAGEDRHHDG